MRQATRACVVAAGTLAAWPGAGVASPLEPAHVPPSAKWAAHVDLEAMASTAVGAFILDQIRRESDDYADIRQGLPGFTLAPEGGLDAITIFGESLNEEGAEDFVALIYGDERIEAWADAIANAYRQHGVEEASILVGATTVWPIPLDEGDGGTVYAGMLRRGEHRLWVVADDVAELGVQLEHLAGGAAGNQGLARLGWRDGTIAMAAARDLAGLADFEDLGAVIGQAESIVGRVGEADGQVFVEGSLRTDAPEKADQIARVLDGLLALGAMMAGQDPELAAVMEFVRGVAIDSVDGRIRVTLTHDADAAVQFLKDAGENGWEHAHPDHDDDHDDHDHDEEWDWDDDEGDDA